VGEIEITADTYRERVRALLPALREQLRRVPDETFKDFQEAGLFRCLQPRRYGGYELDPGTFYEAIMEVGTVCGAPGQ
jgi:3-hydroxy-9,10-secoandrosta-1,3,5(10)-triene-9,17-dione monooxygenase